jgi:hypothetical protein
MLNLKHQLKEKTLIIANRRTLTWEIGVKE